MNENVESLLGAMEETMTHLHDEGEDWLAAIVQEAFDFIEEKLQEEVIQVKVGDLIECKQTSERGVIVSTRTSIGGRDPIIRITYGVDWFTSNLDKPSWTEPSGIKVIKPYE